jgi:hypothetical protein
MANDREKRLSAARSQLEAGLKPAAIALRLQVKFNVSRATAYRDITDASNDLHASDDGPASDEQLDNGSDLAHRLLYDADLCLARGQYADACRLVSAADKVKRWHGLITAAPISETGYV